jgi:translation initiation factor 3 subunit L
LFNHLLNSPPTLDLDLPNQWLWDMIDEFIYQFQSFCQYRSKLKGKSTEQLTNLKNNPQVWNVSTVINYLQSLVTKSGIIGVGKREIFSH